MFIRKNKKNSFKLYDVTEKEIYNIKKNLEKTVNNFISTKIEWIPNNIVELSNTNLELINNFLEALDNNEDVQNFFTNLNLEKS